VLSAPVHGDALPELPTLLCIIEHMHQHVDLITSKLEEVIIYHNCNPIHPPIHPSHKVPPRGQWDDYIAHLWKTIDYYTDKKKFIRQFHQERIRTRQSHTVPFIIYRSKEEAEVALTRILRIIADSIETGQHIIKHVKSFLFETIADTLSRPPPILPGSRVASSGSASSSSSAGARAGASHIEDDTVIVAKERPPLRRRLARSEFY